MPSRGDDQSQIIASLERELHRVRCHLEAETEARQSAEARAKAWRRVAEWIHAAADARIKELERAVENLA